MEKMCVWSYSSIACREKRVWARRGTEDSRMLWSVFSCVARLWQLASHNAAAGKSALTGM